MEWLTESVSSWVVFIVVTWVVLGIPSSFFWLNDDYSKNPFKNMWMTWEAENYNTAGKIILSLCNIILGLPICIMYYLIQLVGLIYQLAVKLFDLIFKKKEE